ncbi:ClpP/crotonase [Sodiomyces alkalinus F11]|uniref:ClpP/crotonase n=1 Tax=Sodiomyces alkalinus (strain CBS 110278 / VKM F-3762 / F11) TaxID=1314773 RepID=A0A3N2Q3P8_SODAK|nr:ClpP/crotonase [Sodiomyces alkalinus F11]ROT41372.1 ClpP/crotonase [Sodiomyces alkalinus F11]
MGIQGYDTFKYFLVSSPSEYVAQVEINRPDKLNAFSPPVWLEFGRLFAQLSHDPDVRAVVLSGAGPRAFTAGLDVQAASSKDGLLSDVFHGDGRGDKDAARQAAALRRHIVEFQDSIGAVEKCEKPVICVMHGVSLGLAIDIACCADVRVCTRDVRLAVKEVDIGIPADIGSLARLPRIVGSMSWVKDVCLTARDFSADEALAVGFVSQVHKDKAAAVQAALQLATFIAAKSPVAVQGTKELLNHARDHSVAENLRYTTVWNSSAVQSNDLKAALLSGLRKSKPRFEKL